MTNLTRLTGKLFGETATATGEDPEIGQFGSGLAGTYVGTTDVETIQNLPAWSNGFIDSVTPTTQFPPLPEMTGFGKVLSYQENYLLQKGIAEWDSNTTYYTNDFCRVGNVVYYSTQDNNTNHNPLVTDGYWNIYTGNNTQITNCVTEIPQDINFELSTGTLILKAGSKIYVPNGFEQDGITRKFNAITIDTDKNYTYTTNGRYFIVCNASGTDLVRCNIQSYSGDTVPSSLSAGVLWYDTTNNLCKRYDGSVWSNFSFPLAIVTVRNNEISSIDVLFNGFGYVGATYFILPNVKALFADGRNADGTYKNYEVIYSNIVIGEAGRNTYSKSISIGVGVIDDTLSSHYMYGTKRGLPSTVDDNDRWRYYAIDENEWYTTSGSTTANWVTQKNIIIGGNIGDGTYITEFQLNRMPVKLVGFNDVDGRWIPSVLNVATSVSWSGSSDEATYSLASYLPNDGFNYEVLVRAEGETTATSGKYIAVKLNTDLLGTGTNKEWATMFIARTRTSSIVDGGGSCIIPVGGGRYIKQYASDSSNAGGTYSIRLLAYRRIGRNV